MDGALGEDSALELAKGGIEFGGLSVLHDEACEHALFAGSDESEELGGAGMNVGCVETAALEEDGGSGDTEGRQDGEVATLSKIDLTELAGLDTWVGLGVEVELEIDLPCVES